MKTSAGLLVFVMLVLVGGAEGRSFYDSLYALRKRPARQHDCPIYENEAAHAAFDRICDFCHDMYRESNPNFRSECRSNCFDNGLFSLCLMNFNPEVGGHGVPLPRRMHRVYY